jgi:hypothetical protein
MSIVRKNLMTQLNYTPYCGSISCYLMPRTHFNGKQFFCKSCNWESSFEESFIKEYKKKWGLK